MVGSPNSSEGSQLRFPHGENSATVDTPGLGPEDTTTLGARWNLGFVRAHDVALPEGRRVGQRYVLSDNNHTWLAGK